MTKSEQSIYDLLCKSAPNRFITDEQETEARMIHAGLLRLGWRPPVPRHVPDPGPDGTALYALERCVGCTECPGSGVPDPQPARDFLNGVRKVEPGESSGR